MKKTDSIKRMREESGNIKSSDKLTCFLYILGRDYLSIGKIEEIVSMISEDEDEKEYVYTNGWLAKYCIDVSNRLKNETT